MKNHLQNKLNQNTPIIPVDAQL